MRTLAICFGSRRPPEIERTRSVIVAAAFTDSCCERIELAKAEKLLSEDLITPIGHGENSATTSAKRGSMRAISRPIARERCAEIATPGR